MTTRFENMERGKPSSSVAGCGDPVPTSLRRGLRLAASVPVTLLLAATSLPAKAQEPGWIQGPASSGFDQCQQNFDVVWATHFEKHRKQLEILTAAITDYKAKAAALRNERIWMGMGPRVLSDTTLGVSQGFQAVKLMADLIEGLGGGYAVDLSIGDDLSNWRTFYFFLKEGKHINKLVDQESWLGVVKVLVPYFGKQVKKFNLKKYVPYATTVWTLYENAKAFTTIDEEWRATGTEIRKQLAMLDGVVKGAEQKIATVQKQMYRATKQGFDKYCAERRSEPPPAPKEDLATIRDRIRQLKEAAISKALDNAPGSDDQALSAAIRDANSVRDSAPSPAWAAVEAAAQFGGSPVAGYGPPPGIGPSNVAGGSSYSPADFERDCPGANQRLESILRLAEQRKSNATSMCGTHRAAYDGFRSAAAVLRQCTGVSDPTALRQVMDQAAQYEATAQSAERSMGKVCAR